MKNSNSRVYFKGSPIADIQLDKTQSKFNRKQILNKGAGRKMKSVNRQDERICYMSPDRINNLLISSSNSIYEAKSPGIFMGSPGLHQEQSFIKNIGDVSDHCKMSDSLLSIYNQLEREGVGREELQKLREQVERLNQVVEKLKEEQSINRQALQQKDGLQQFLMQRQTYICEIHEQNIELLQKNGKLMKEKQFMCKENDYLRKILQKQKEQHHSDARYWKGQCELQQAEKQKIQKMYKELKDECNISEEREQFRSQTSSQADQTVVEYSRHQNNYNQIKLIQNSPLQLQRLPSLQNLTPFKRKGDQPYRRSYRELLSSRSGKVTKPFDQQDEDSYKRSKQFTKECGCRPLIESLYQKIRYNEIQIDILKRVKASGETQRNQNQKLKRQNANLYSRIEYMTDRKREKKRKKSDSSLQLSLTPKKGRK